MQVKKNVSSKFCNKNTEYSSSSGYNSPEYLGFKTLHKLLEGVKKKIFLQNYRTFFNFFGCPAGAPYLGQKKIVPVEKKFLHPPPSKSMCCKQTEPTGV